MPWLDYVLVKNPLTQFIQGGSTGAIARFARARLDERLKQPKTTLNSPKNTHTESRKDFSLSVFGGKRAMSRGRKRSPGLLLYCRQYERGFRHHCNFAEGYPLLHSQKSPGEIETLSGAQHCLSSKKNFVAGLMETEPGGTTLSRRCHQRGAPPPPGYRANSGTNSPCRRAPAS